MGWKGTTTISRAEAIARIIIRIHECSDSELGDALSSLGFGDNQNLPYYGCNFDVQDGYVKDEGDEETEYTDKDGFKRI